MAIEKLTRESFEAFLQSNPVVVVDFYADWCGPCRMLTPVLESIAETTPAVKVAKVNVDECGELAMRFGISSIPFVAVFRGGKLAASSVGYVSERALRERLGL